MIFTKVPLKLELEITHLISLHYFEFAKDFIFEGEKHDFWELVYVDAGEIEVTADHIGYALKQGDIIFHKPNEYHSLWANNRIAPNIIVISFECRSAAMQFFEGKMFNLDNDERNLLASAVKHGFLAFETPMGHELINRADASFGAEQHLKIYLELLLLRILSQDYIDTGEKRLSTTAKERNENEVIDKLIAYMEDHVTETLSLEQLCSHLHISKTFLTRLFKQKTGQSMMHYYTGLKIEKAKRLIRERQHNFTEIAEILHYTSIHSFSRQFKNMTELTPSEYARSIQARL